MLKPNCYRSVIAALIIALCTAHIAEAAVVRGTVRDTSGNPLPGALVRVEGALISTTSGRDGRYRLANVPSGPQQVVFEFLGTPGFTADVDLADGSEAVIDAELSLSRFGEEVNVSGEPILEGQAKALNQQRTAPNIMNIVASDQIGQFPDTNAAEATQRIPGVTLQRDQGEGRYVILRGLDPRLNSMMINGERIPSPEGSVRQVALDVIPADLLEAIEVSKTLTPDMDGDAIGGAVNLITKRVPAGRRTSFMAGYGENDISDDGQMRGSITHGQRFDDDRAGVLISAHYHDTDRGSENFEVEYDDGDLEEFEIRDYQVNREREGLALDLDYRTSDTSEIRLRGIYNEFADQEFRRRRVDKVADGEVEREVKDRLEVQKINALSLGGNNWVGGRWLLDYRVAFATAEEDEPNRVDSVYLQEDVLFAPNVTPGSIDPNNIQTNALNENLGAFALDEVVREDNFTSEDDLVAAVDFTLPKLWGGSRGGLIKAGAKVRFKDKDRDNNALEFGLDDVLLIDNLSNFSDPGFLDGRYDLGQFHTPSSARQQIVGLEGERDIEEDLADYDTSEDTIAVYGMAELYLNGRATLIGGLRYEATDNDFSAFQLIFDEEGDPEGLTPVSGSNDYSILMPNLQIVWEVAPLTNVRAAITRSLARPDFADLAPFELILREDSELERGNPELDPTRSWNLDVLFERYLEPLGLVSGGFFYKDIDDGIFTFVTEEIRNGQDFEVTQPRNGDSAEIRGFEVAFQKLWDFGLGVYANYTFTDSEANFPDRPDTTFPGQADNTGNLALSFEKERFSVRLSVNYHDVYLEEVGSSPASDIFVDEHTQIDLSGQVRINDRFAVLFEAINLDDEPFRRFIGTSDRPVQEEYYSYWWLVGLRVDL